MTPDLRARLLRALEAEAPPSSDYDLVPEWVPAKGARLRHAGVLVAVRETADGPTVILTKRSSALKHHPGQIAFPGGKVDAGDDGPVGAALREAEEEIALPRDAVEVLGALPPHETVTAFEVTPVLALVTRAFDPVPEAGEVEEVFETPLNHVLNPANYSIQSRRWRGQRRAYFTVPYGPYYIWGATARMLRALADRMADDPN
ncbi:MAG: CoA pyrophosphatase [Paracoccaceae bacterium]|nr:CoA pyrophosphatase [Paracoccaceae bacterium]